jgi:hypothetical protein
MAAWTQRAVTIMPVKRRVISGSGVGDGLRVSVGVKVGFGDGVRVGSKAVGVCWTAREGLERKGEGEAAFFSSVGRSSAGWFCEGLQAEVKRKRTRKRRSGIGLAFLLPFFVM